MKDLKDILEECTLEFFGKHKHKVTPQALADVPNALLLDVRSREEKDTLAVPLGAYSNVEYVHVPIDELPGRADELPRDKNILVFCPSNFRSTLAYAYLKSVGFDSVRILAGGYDGLVSLVMPGPLYKHISSQK